VGISDLLILLGAWDVCGAATSGPPQDVLDCLDKFCCAEEDMLALEMCLCAVDPECEITQ